MQAQSALDGHLLQRRRLCGVLRGGQYVMAACGQGQGGVAANAGTRAGNQNSFAHIKTAPGPGPREQRLGLGLEAFAHELFALVALQVFGFGLGIAGFHLVLLGGAGLGR